MAPRQANLFPVDVEQVWEDFCRTSKCDPEIMKRRSIELAENLVELREKRDALQAECDAIEKEMSSLVDRDRRAKAHLESVAKALGKLATARVLTESLLEAFPPIGTPSTKRKRGRPAAERPAAAPQPPAADGEEVPVDNEIRASMIRSFLLDTLDQEGLKVSDLLKSAPKDSGFTRGELRTMLRHMVADGSARILEGRGAGALYAKPEIGEGR